MTRNAQRTEPFISSETFVISVGGVKDKAGLRADFSGKMNQPHSLENSSLHMQLWMDVPFMIETSGSSRRKIKCREAHLLLVLHYSVHWFLLQLLHLRILEALSGGGV